MLKYLKENQDKISKWLLVCSLIFAFLTGTFEIYRSNYLQDFGTTVTQLDLFDRHQVLYNGQLRMINILKVEYNFLIVFNLTSLDLTKEIGMADISIQNHRKLLQNDWEKELFLVHEEINLDIAHSEEFDKYINFLSNKSEEMKKTLLSQHKKTKSMLERYTFLRNITFFLVILLQILSVLIKKELE